MCQTCNKLQTLIPIRAGTADFSVLFKLGGVKGEILQKTFLSMQVTTS